MAAQTEGPQALTQGLQHLHRRALPALQRAAQGRQTGLQLGQAFQDEAQMTGRAVGLGDQLGFEEVYGQHRATAGGVEQGGVVGDPQVALEPDDGDHACQRRRGGGWPALAQKRLKEGHRVAGSGSQRGGGVSSAPRWARASR